MAKSKKTALQKRLKTFFQLNPTATLRVKNGTCVITKPWNDESVTIHVDAENNYLLRALNKLLLPPPLVAIWHTDTRDLEIIFTVFVVESAYYTRSFDFHFKGNTYTCEFAEASQRLMAMVEAFRPAKGPSNSNYRNLDHFQHFIKYGNKKSAKGIIGKPIALYKT